MSSHRYLNLSSLHRMSPQSFGSLLVYQPSFGKLPPSQAIYDAVRSLGVAPVPLPPPFSLMALAQTDILMSTDRHGDLRISTTYARNSGYRVRVGVGASYNLPTLQAIDIAPIDQWRCLIAQDLLYQQ